MKQILSFLLFLLPAIAFAQWPAAPNKIRLGNQTTGDGLVFRGSGAPGYTPTGINNAWMYLDTVAEVLYYHVGGVWEPFVGTGSGTDTSGYNLSFAVVGDSLVITDGAGSLAVATSDISASTDLQFTGSSDVVQLDAGGTPVFFSEGNGVEVTQSGDTLTIAVDTATVIASKTWVNTLGFPIGSGTANRLARWATSTTLGDGGVEDDGAGLISILGTRAARIPVGPTANRSGAPVAGEIRVNSSNSNALEWYTGTAYEVPVRAASATGLGTSGYVLYNDANGRATGSANLFWDNSNTRLGIGTNAPGGTVDVRGDVRALKSIVGLTVVNNVGGLGTGFLSQVNSSLDFNTSKSALGNHAGGVAELIFKSRSTNGTSYAAVQANDNIYTQSFAVDGGSSSVLDFPAQFNVSVDGNKTANNYYPTRVDWYIRTNLNTDTYHRFAFRASGRFGVLTEDPQQTLHVAGKIRQDTLSDTAESIAGWTGTTGPGVATRVEIGSGLSLTSGTLSATGGGGVQYSDSLTTFVTPTMLADTAAAIRGDFPTDTNLANTDLVNSSVYRTYTIPNTHNLDFIDQGGGNNFLARFSNRGFLTADKPTILLQIRDSVSTNFSNLLMTPDRIDLFANKLTMKMPPVDTAATRLLAIDPITREVLYVPRDSVGLSGLTAGNGLTRTGNQFRLGGTLDANTTISGDFSLTRSGSLVGSALTVTNAGSSNAFGITSTATSKAFVGTTSGTGAITADFSTSSGTTLLASSSNTNETFTVASIIANTTTTNSVHKALRLQKTLASGTAANGIGVGTEYRAQTSTGANQIIGSTDFLWSDVTDASRTGRFDLNITNSGTTARKLSLSGPGQLTLDGYTTNSFIGTGWARLAVDASGVVVADTTTTGGGGPANLAFTGTAGVIELDAGGTPVYIAEGSGVDVTQSGDTLTIAADTATVLASKTWVNGQGFLRADSIFSTWTTAARPGAPAAGRAGFNTTNANIDFYSGTAWENPVKSATATGLGTAGRVFYADANGRAATDAELYYDASNNRLAIGGVISGSTPTYTLELRNASAGTYVWRENANPILEPFCVLRAGTDTNSATAYGGQIRGIGTEKGLRFTDVAGTTEFFRATVNGLAIGDTSPQRTLHVTGEVRITDLTTDTPTRLVGADADGDLGAVTAGTGITVGSTISFNRGAPVTKTADFTVGASENWLIVNNASANTTVTLPTASSNTGREIMLKNLSGTYTVISNASNVVPIDGTSAGTAILPATAGAWCTLVSDGTNWVIMQQ